MMPRSSRTLVAGEAAPVAASPSPLADGALLGDVTLRRRPLQPRAASTARRGARLACAAAAALALIWLVVAPWRRAARPPSVCLAAPLRWTDVQGRERTAAATTATAAVLEGGVAGGATGTAAGRLASAGSPSFVLLWTTSVERFGLRSRRCIESIFFHHPHASVRRAFHSLP